MAEEHDALLTQWMSEHLDLGWLVHRDLTSLIAIETKLIRAVMPLNLTHGRGPITQAARAGRAVVADALLGNDVPRDRIAEALHGPQAGCVPRDRWSASGQI